MAKAKKPAVTETKETESWQKQKSAMTRERILDGAIECFNELGFNNVTTSKLAAYAGVSRGAMLHHFPSKTDVIEAAVDHLHDKLLLEYSKQVSKVPATDDFHKRNRLGIEAYWKYLSSDLFIAYHELCVAGRTNPELNEILQDSIARFDEHVFESNAKLFPEWADRGELFYLAMDLTKFLMEGMAVGQVVYQRKKRVRRMLDYLGDRLEEIFEAEDESAIFRHAEK